MKALIVIVLFLLLALLLITISAGSAADYNQAQAAVEAARAAQIAAAGQTAGTVANTVLVVLLVVVVIAAGGLIAWLIVHNRRLEAAVTQLQAGQGSKWAPGPNAGYKRLPQQPNQAELLQALLMAQLLNNQQQLPAVRPQPVQPEQPPEWRW